MTDERAGEPGSDRPEPTDPSEPGRTPPSTDSAAEPAGSAETSEASGAPGTPAPPPGQTPYTYGPSYGQQPYGAYQGAYPGAYPGGYPPPPPYGGYPSQPSGPVTTGPRNGLGIAALITAIAGLVLCWSIIGGIVVGAVAIVLGFLGHSRAKRGEATNGGVAITGIVLGGIAVVLSLAFIAIWVTLGVRWFEDLGGREYLTCLEEAGNDQAAQEQCRVRFEQRVEDEFGAPSTRTR
ncbi:DUF4190 domain-containing protein [Mycolicibacterium goodii]|uniref:DUF4190 domain-containing protein n=1 Tax=Mycolicibacterium goodii TaxID=134601 RepID=UPI001F04980E|nr:DUF4190 domain-containing protein [Mycolicibacterium goodii]ULN50603.1 DUF4190 domain-containing protein [Mycolicibacterium goodii]